MSTTSTVKVKALVWTHHPASPCRLAAWQANVGNGRFYQICAPYRADEPFYLYTEAGCLEDPTHPPVPHDTLVAAQAAAQNEWEAFVLAALETLSP